MKVWAFSGQGSQRKGMGAELFDSYPDHLEKADRVLGYSIRQLCLDNPDNRLGRTEFAQPALFTVNALAFLHRAAGEPLPDFLAGHSLGELNALHAAGCYDFETGLGLVRLRGELMGQAAGGQMAAVVGMSPAALAELLAAEPAEEVDIANHNSPTQVVLAGPPEPLERAIQAISARPGVRCVRLNLSSAFHSRYMADAAVSFNRRLAAVRFAPPRIPVVANATGQLYADHDVAEVLGRQVDNPVRWHACMRLLLGRGVRELSEVGPGRALAGMWRETQREYEQQAVAQAVPAPSRLVAGVAGRSAATPGTVVSPVVQSPAVQSSAVRSSAVANPADSSPADPAARLGSAAFRTDFGLRYAYLTGSMFRGVASVELVRRMGAAGLLGFFGTGGLKLTEVEDAICTLKNALGPDRGWGMNLLYPLDDAAAELATVELYLRHQVPFIEAAGYSRITPALVQLRFSGARIDPDGQPVAGRRVIAKVSRPETAAAFLQPAPAGIVTELRNRGALTALEAELAGRLPISEDVCVESDSAGHTDGGVALSLVPSLCRLRDELAARHGYPRGIRIGAAGGLGTPEAVAAAFLLGAEFVMTGSVNQCTPEAGTSDTVKDMLAELDVQDTTYAPAGDMFELGARVQVARKGTLFAARANKLYQLYRTHGGLAELEPRLRETLERTYFRRSLEEVWLQTREYHQRVGHSAELERAERDPKHQMALVFRWYFANTVALAAEGRPSEKANYQIHASPAMGAFNRFVAGTPLEDWRNRHVEAIAELLMRGAADRLQACARMNT